MPATGFATVAPMCTLLLGVGIPTANTVLLGANRDEAPARASDPPGVLLETPRVVGGRDRVAGGTWLAIRERRAVIAMLNRQSRHGHPLPPDPTRRSRGLLALEAAAADAAPGESLGAAVTRRAAAAVRTARYAPFTLVFASPDASWSLEWDGEALRQEPLGPGWHVVTHAGPDDPREPRTARLLEATRDARPTTAEEGERMLRDWLALHADGHPRRAVCIHEGRMVTVSAAIVRLGGGDATFAHAEGRPCVTPFASYAQLLEGPAS
jgi:uncharacterized protein with NRDE domain